MGKVITATWGKDQYRSGSIAKEILNAVAHAADRQGATVTWAEKGLGVRIESRIGDRLWQYVDVTMVPSFSGDSFRRVEMTMGLRGSWVTRGVATAETSALSDALRFFGEAFSAMFNASNRRRIAITAMMASRSLLEDGLVSIDPAVPRPKTLRDRLDIMNEEAAEDRELGVSRGRGLGLAG